MSSDGVEKYVDSAPIIQSSCILRQSWPNRRYVKRKDAECETQTETEAETVKERETEIERAKQPLSKEIPCRLKWKQNKE